jgi:DNA-binding transcriptional LysR family regulator
LFDRQRNNIQLTAAGEKLIRYAESIVTTWIRAKQEIGIEDENMIPFVVGAMPSLWDAVLGNWMSFLNTTMPDVVINAEVHDPEVLSRRVLNGTMDMAFVFDNPQLLDFECEEVLSMPLVMVSSESGLSAQEAVKQNYILVDWGTSFAISHARYFPDLVSPRMHVMLGRIALDYLLANGGTAYMAEPMVTDLIARERLFLVKDAAVIKRSVYAIYPHNSEKRELITHANGYFAK